MTNEEIKKIAVGTEIFFSGNGSYGPMIGVVTRIRGIHAIQPFGSLGIHTYEMEWDSHFCGSSEENEKSLTSNRFILITDEKHKLIISIKHLS